MVFGSVPIYVKKRVWVHAKSWALLLLAESLRTVYFLLLVKTNWHPSPSSASSEVSVYIKLDDICSRSIGPFGLPKEEKEKGCNSSSLSSYLVDPRSYILFPRAALNRSFPTTNQHHFMYRIIFNSVRSNARWGGLRHARAYPGIWYLVPGYASILCTSNVMSTGMYLY